MQSQIDDERRWDGRVKHRVLRMLRISVAAVMCGTVCCVGAETNLAKGLFIVRVEGLRSSDGKTETKKADAGAGPKGESEEFVLETPKEQASVELRVQQIETMNGRTMMRSGIGAGSSGRPKVGRALDFLLPKGRTLLSRNPNARRDPLRMLED